jgi:predicted nucleic acid-binding protein
MHDDFFDSNVILYMLNRADHRKREIAEELVLRASTDGSGCVSFQVVQESLNWMTRRKTEVADAQIQFFLDELLTPMWLVMPSVGLYKSALRVHSRFGFAFYDSLIVAAALQAGSKRLFTEDLQHGQHIDGLLIQNPFAIA